MDRLICAGIFLLALVIAALFYNLGFMVDPEYGLFDESFYSKDGLANVTFLFMTASAVATLGGCLALVGCFFRANKALILASISIAILVIASSVAWWSYSTFFYAVV